MSKRTNSAFERGRNDCLKNISMSKNPYRGKRREIWQAGWESIIAENLARIKWENSDKNEQNFIDYSLEISQYLGIPKKYLEKDEKA